MWGGHVGGQVAMCAHRHLLVQAGHCCMAVEVCVEWCGRVWSIRCHSILSPAAVQRLAQHSIRRETPLRLESSEDNTSDPQGKHQRMKS